MTDYLRFLFYTFNLYEPVLPILKEALLKTKSDQILDLCSGSGGAMEAIYKNLKRTYREDIKVTFSDLFPSLLLSGYLNSTTTNGLSYISTPVDATQVPANLKGFRTLFSSIHHFDKQKAKEVLKNAVEAGEGIGIFDGGDRNIWMILLILVFHPILLWLFTPFFRPFRLSRLLFTYLIPVIPFCTVWDGVFSILRLYKPDELLQIAIETGTDRSFWISGKVRNQFGMKIAYLVGYPTTPQN